MSLDGLSSKSELHSKCRISEIMQYSCDAEASPEGKPTIRCFPISRLFRICEGRPAAEITRMVDVGDDGVVNFPGDAR
ncbi:hypothetical protein Moror_10733 [Moniliophthora roreri MCA 2997]|uniref:Uncharacterized protein n=1 Tax=Moniliophthora roreri (strain MCA 2997) TaxID=1381753 RepID=V2X6I5_MONRO|nr:hypothetical protein Moror_10733 [Moniliophthora roreri MCA 2997]